MNWTRAIWYGVIYFAIMFLIGSIYMFGPKLSGDAYCITMLLSAIIVLCFLSQIYGLKDQGEGTLVGLVWLVVNALLEYLVLVLLFNKGDIAFYTWSVLFSYVLIVLIPALNGSRAKK
jgi:hypothetical protein